ncbi:hypothetical protein SPRG_09501 [Saprolegnia parasitica CBS 223.65]|uniref:Uncharacterized protein n=1 Tax=Saprolegnia parasitica (strain CBS 223.65) TaxID=695850 RepID=A0A067C429_SAPPC|nr:hypothetical protein SPRG_09501 [Saprolegnia parasitica CBS 223.65]KDO25253.1 hypothetical protein SPRG_09501 [Saprolegnia parasitica CBS 223.65]|eukprot:XP_012204086.1 hypothetical protein SPRG_09501 [Saprolegnia parasitica CBS 223.65]
MAYKSLTTVAPFYALMPLFSILHQVYVKCSPLDVSPNAIFTRSWLVTPVLSGRNREPARQTLPAFKNRRESENDIAAEYRPVATSQEQAESGVGTYLGSYVCFAHEGKWAYRLVVDCVWSTLKDYNLLAKTCRGNCYVPVDDATLCVLTTAGYALRPFDDLPVSSHSVADVKTATELIALDFATRDRHAPLDFSQLVLPCTPTTPPSGDTLLPCVFDVWLGEMAVDGVLDQVHAYYTRYKSHDNVLSGIKFSLDNMPIKLPAMAPFVPFYDITDLANVDVPDLCAIQAGATVDTSTLRRLFDGFGDCPSVVYVRKEMRMVWDLLLANFLPTKALTSLEAAALHAVQNYIIKLHSPWRLPDAASMRSAVLVGSPGVGKSVLLVLFCAYLAVHRDYYVFLSRALPANRYLHQEILAVFDAFKREAIARGKKLFVVGDGYNQDDFDTVAPLTSIFGPSDLLSVATYKKRAARLVVTVPAWTKEALEKMASENDLCHRTVGECHAVSGGDVRSFPAPNVVSPSATLEAIESLVARGSAPAMSVDALQHVYIVDTAFYEHYVDPIYRRTIVDTTFVQQCLVAEASMPFFASVVQWAERSEHCELCTSLHAAFVHALARNRKLQLCIEHKTSVKRFALDAEWLIVAAPISEPDGLAYLRDDLGDKTYWYPGHAVCPGVDAILVYNGWVYYLQTTTTSRPIPALESFALASVHAAISSSKKLATYTHAVVLLLQSPAKWSGRLEGKVAATLEAKIPGRRVANRGPSTQACNLH